jgi:hypothetical protein
MSRRGLWIAAALLIVAPLDARCDDACAAHGSLVERGLAARRRVVAAEQEAARCESIPLSGKGGYRDARIAAAERELVTAEAREAEIDTTARNLGVPSHCFDASDVHASDD